VRVVAGFIAGPVLLVAVGYGVAHWHAVAWLAGLLAVAFVVAVVIEMVRQQAEYRERTPRFDPDAQARAAFAVDPDGISPSRGTTYRRPRAGPRPASYRPPHPWRASDFDGLIPPR